jgi:hypothetical protein
MTKENTVFAEPELIRRIRFRFSDPHEWRVLDHVNAATGYGGSWVDAIAINLWPSGGYQRLAFECKSTRGDFLREMAAPTKNAWVRRYCHQIWYVAATDVIHENEVPSDAGWMTPRGDDELVVRKHAPRNATATLDDSFFASLLRSACAAMAEDDSITRKRILENDERYLQAKIWMTTAEKFIRERGLYVDSLKGECAGQITQALEKATMDEKTRMDRAQLMGSLSEFQSRIGDLAEFFLVFAHVALLATDDLGEYLVGDWRDKYALIPLCKAKAIQKLRGRYRDPRRCNLATMITAIQELAAEFAPPEISKAEKEES